MDKVLFEEIMGALQARIEACSAHLDKYKEDADLVNVSVKTLQEDITFAREEQARMDQVKHNEIYHILGMGNLTASQMMSFAALVSKYTNYSPDLKTIAGISAIMSVPRLKTQAQYQLSVLSTRTLVKKIRDGEPPVIDVEYDTISVPATSQPTAKGSNSYELGNLIVRNLEQFYKDIRLCKDRSINTIKKDSVMQLGTAKDKLFGLEFKVLDTGEIICSDTSAAALKVCSALVQ